MLARHLVVRQPDQDGHPWQPKYDEGGRKYQAGTQFTLGILIQYDSRQH